MRAQYAYYDDSEVIFEDCSSQVKEGIWKAIVAGDTVVFYHKSEPRLATVTERRIDLCKRIVTYFVKWIGPFED